MMRSLQHRFVQYMPETLELGMLYISLEYVTASHLCCCGCGKEVVTPFSPVGWRMTFDGETVSLWPSIGNWNLRCRSHYVIDRGRVVGAGPWTDDQIALKRRLDKEMKDIYFGKSRDEQAVPQKLPVTQPSPEKPSWWRRLRRWFFGR